MALRPMLAAKADNIILKSALLQHPLLVSYKIDGIRGLTYNKGIFSRSGKPIRNKYIQEIFSKSEFQGLDGELIVGLPFGPNVMQSSYSGTMSFEGQPDFSYYIFDMHNVPGTFDHRNLRAKKFVEDLHSKGIGSFIKYLDQYLVRNLDELLELEAKALESGYEGLIIRDPKSLYKNGRSSVNEGSMFKLKRFDDSEAVITGFEELMHNENPEETNELGYTTRGHSGSGLRPAGTLGKFLARDLHNPVWNNLKIGSGPGLTQQLRQYIWDHRPDYLHRIIKYKFFNIGIVDSPRHPNFLGFRDPDDI